MMPNIHISGLAILISVVATFIFGFIWYTPLFGKAWAKELGLNMDRKPTTGEFMKGIVLNLFGNLLMAWVLAHNCAVWNPTTWGLPESTEMTPGFMAVMSGLFTWLGFFLPTDLSTIAWEGKSMKLFFINTFYHLGNVMIASFILIFVH